MDGGYSIGKTGVITDEYAPEGDATRGATGSNTRWLLKKNAEQETVAVFKREIAKRQERRFTIEAYEEAINDTMNRAHRRKKRDNRRTAYWWNAEIAEQRKRTMAARRRLTRANKRTPDNTTRQLLKNSYDEEKK